MLFRLRRAICLIGPNLVGEDRSVEEQTWTGRKLPRTWAFQRALLSSLSPSIAISQLTRNLISPLLGNRVPAQPSTLVWGASSGCSVSPHYKHSKPLQIMGFGLCDNNCDPRPNPDKEMEGTITAYSVIVHHSPGWPAWQESMQPHCIRVLQLALLCQWGPGPNNGSQAKLQPQTLPPTHHKDSVCPGQGN